MPILDGEELQILVAKKDPNPIPISPNNACCMVPLTWVWMRPTMFLNSFEMEKWRTIKPKSGDLESLESTQFRFVMVIHVYAISTSTWDVDKMRILYQMGPQQDTFHFTNLWSSNVWVEKKLHLGENHIAIFENPTYHCITVTAIYLIYLWHVGGPRCGVYMSNYIVIYIYTYIIIIL